MRRSFYYFPALISVVLLESVSFMAVSQKPTNTFPVIKPTSFKSATYNIKNYGAKSDGVFLNTKSIQGAIDDCNAKGGGKVIVPVGIWLTGPLTLKSNVNLILEKNALLQFTSDFDQYPLVEGNYEGLPQMRNQSPLSAIGQVNIGVYRFRHYRWLGRCVAQHKKRQTHRVAVEQTGGIRGYRW